MAEHKVTVEIKSGGAKKKKRPEQNKKGGDKQPSRNPDGGARPQVKPSGPAGPPSVNPQAQLSVSAEAPIQDPSSPFHPVPTQDTRQVRHNINFKDMPPVGQNALLEQQGVDLDAPRKMLEQGANQAVAEGPGQGPVPNALVGPGVPPGVESLPQDIVALQEMMKKGYAPGANPAETGLAQNADSMLKAQAAMAQSQSLAPGGPPPVGAPPSPLAPSPDMGVGPTPEAPTTPGAPGGIPPELIAALEEEARKKKLRLGGPQPMV